VEKQGYGAGEKQTESKQNIIWWRQETGKYSSAKAGTVYGKYGAARKYVGKGNQMERERNGIAGIGRQAKTRKYGSG